MSNLPGPISWASMKASSTVDAALHALLSRMSLPKPLRGRLLWNSSVQGTYRKDVYGPLGDPEYWARHEGRRERRKAARGGT